MKSYVTLAVSFLSLAFGRPAFAQFQLGLASALQQDALRAPQALDAGAGERKAPPLIRQDKPAFRVLGPSEASGELLARLDLEPLHNRLWKTALTVQMGGRTFHLSGEASDESNYHVVVTDQKTGRPTFLRELDLIMGGIEIKVGGRPYRLWVKPNLLDLYGSHLQISPDGGSFEIRAIMRSMFEAGQAMAQGGRAFRVHYTDQIFEGEDGRILRHGEPLLVLMVEQAEGSFKGERSRFQGDAIRGSDLPAGVTVRAPFKIAPYGLFELDLRRSEDGRTVEILAPAR